MAGALAVPGDTGAPDAVRAATARRGDPALLDQLAKAAALDDVVDDRGESFGEVVGRRHGSASASRSIGCTTATPRCHVAARKPASRTWG